jgi:pseudaminic acid synthase
MNESEFKEMVVGVREAEKAIGLVNYELTEKQSKGKDFSRSLYVVEDIKEGDIVTVENVRSIRPGFGLHPKYLNSILGKAFISNIDKGTRFSLKLIK